MQDYILGVPERDEEFEDWWFINHPWDWFAKERKGIPLPHFDRLLVYNAARQAWDAGKIAAVLDRTKER